MKRVRLGTVPLFLVSLCLFPSVVSAQTTTATFLGQVKDTSEAVVPGATITVTNVETGIQRTAVSDEEGRYRIGNLPPGDYEISAELPGFRTEIRKGIRLTVGREAVVEFTLDTAAVTESLVVTGEAPMVETTSSDMGGLVSTEQVATLPLNARDYSQLITLQAGAVQYRGSEGNVQAGFGARISVSGARTSMNAFSIDGVNVNTAAGQLPSGVGQATLGVESMREFQILTSNYSAEHGRAAGANIIAITKSGTNQEHGSLFLYHRNDGLDAKNFFDRGEQPDFKRNQFGFSLGGRIVRDRAFYFTSYEGLRQTLGLTRIANVPTASARLGILPGRTVNVSPLIAPYLSLWPLPNGRDNGDGTGEFLRVDSQPTNQNYFTVRLDYQLSSKHSTFGRWTSDRSTRVNPDNLGLFAQDLGTKNEYGTFQFQSIFSSSMVGTARFGLNRDISTHEHLARVNLDPSLSFIEGRKFGNLSVTGIAGLEGLSGGITPYDSNMMVPQFHYSINYTRGKHVMKVGATVERLLLDRKQDQLEGGSVSFGNLDTFLTNGLPSRFRMKGPDDRADPFRKFRQTVTAFYVQDDWSLLPNLTINAGVRHDYSTSPTETEGRLSNIRFVLDPAPTVGEPFFDNPQAKNFAPRVGFAWDPTGSGKTSVRGGFGLFYEPLTPKQYLITMVLQPPFWSAPDPLRPQLAGLFPRVSQAQLRELAKGPESVHALDFDLDTPHMYHLSMSVQRNLIKDIVVTATFTSTRGENLVSRADFNVPTPTFLADGTLFYEPTAGYLNPNFGRYNRYGTQAISRYNGLHLSFDKRYRDGLQFQLSYTVSKNLDTQTGHFSTEAGGTTYMNPFDPLQDYGLAATDVRQNFSGNFIYDLPFGRTATGVRGGLLGGWQVAGIVTLAAGNPFTVTANQTLTHPLLQEGNVRPNLAPGASNNPILGGVTQYFDPTAFLIPVRGFYGDVGRNTLIGPGFATADLSVIKNVRIGSTHRVQFRSEFFNMFNRANFGAPASNVFDSAGRRVGTAGRITSTASTGRQIQLAVRYEF